jgi:ligand-binding sensor domain-containing protein/AraC-like DNA-binding protein
MPEGIEQNSISDIIADTTGQMWFGTKDGLVRYNGKEMFVYKNDPNNLNSLPHNTILFLYVDSVSTGDLWIATKQGICKYQPKTDDFAPIFEKVIGKTPIVQIIENGNQFVWLLNYRDNKLFRYSHKTKKIELLINNNLEDGFGKIKLVNGVATKNNRLFFTEKERGIIEYFPETRKFKRIPFFSNSEIERFPHLKSKLTTISQDKRTGNIWVGTNFGFLINYNIRTDEVQRYYFRKNLAPRKFWYVMNLFEDSENNLWISTWFDGEYKILPDRKTQIHITPTDKNNASISNSITGRIFQDRAGYIWISTEFAGVNIEKKNKKFFVIKHKSNNSNSLPQVPLLSVAKDNSGRVWIGTDTGGLYFFDENTKQLVNTGKTIVPDAIRFFSLFFDSKGFLWMGTENGLYKYHPQNKTLKHFEYERDSYSGLGGKNIVTICEDKNGNIWLGTIHRGLTKYNPLTNKFYRFMPDKDDPKSLSDKYVSKIFCDSKNQIWVGTLNGLNKFNEKTGNFTIFRNDKKDPKSISSSSINNICELNGELWIATQGGGIDKFDRNTNSFVSFTKENGLPSDNVKGIIANNNNNNNNNLWLSTTNNIVKFNPDTHAIITYGTSDGLQNSMYIRDYGWQKLEFMETLSFKDKQGYLYFGGIGGLFIFHPDSLPENSFKAPVLLDKFMVNGKRFVTDSTLWVKLKPNQNHLEFDITILNYIQPEKNEYAWKLQGYDTAWYYAGHKSHAEYFDLPAGEYKFLFKAANNDNVWSAANNPTTIVIENRFYKTMWFYLVVVLFIISLIVAFAGYKWHIKKQLYKKRKQMRYSTSNLDLDKAKIIEKKLSEVLNETQIYLEPDLTLQKLASVLGVKSHYLSQVINQFYNRNFHEFINTYRVKNAKKLLRETSLKIEAVAYDSGFNSISTFNTAFKKSTNLTPLKYRKDG